MQGRRGSYFQAHIFKHRLYISALEKPRVLKLRRYILLGVLNTVYYDCHALSDFCEMKVKEQFLDHGSISQLWNML